MAKRERVVKRIYEKGREETVYAKKRYLAGRRETKPSSKPRKIAPIPARSRIVSSPRIPAQPAKRGIFVDSYDLPSHYGFTRLTLMVKDPFWIFAYWELAPDYLESLRGVLSQEDIENAKVVLRMYDVTLIDFNGHNANRYFDIEVGPHTNNWYINLLTDNVSYIGDLGLRTLDGRFFTLARSNHVHTPRVSYSPRTEQMWMRVTEEKERRPYVVAKTELLQPPEAKAVTPVTSALMRKKRKIYLAEQDIRDFYAGLNPSLKDIISSRLSRTHHIGKIKKEVGGYRFILEGENKADRERIFSMLPGKYFIEKVRTGSSEEIVLLEEEGHVAGSGGASEYLHEKIKRRKFFFELATELIVYGRTEPDAELWLGDKKIELRSDGTFSLRFYLPDGKLPLEFKAISKDKEETRKINTYVERRAHNEN